MRHHALRAAPALVTGTDKHDTFLGTIRADAYYGGQGSDLIGGGQGSDWLYGGSGKDTLIGGTGQDFLYGGSGADTFVYEKIGDAGGPTKHDVIRDFQAGSDHIDLHGFMAGGHFIGAAEFVAEEGPTLRYVKASGLLSGDVDGDGVADFAIKFANHAVLTESDFLF
jgi:serralysin